MYHTAANQRGDTDSWFNEKILDNTTKDVDKGNMKFMNAYIETELDYICTNIHHELTEVSEAEAKI